MTIHDDDIDDYEIYLTSSGLTGGLLLDMTQPICRTATSEFLLINSCGTQGSPPGHRNRISRSHWCNTFSHLVLYFFCSKCGLLLVILAGLETVALAVLNPFSILCLWIWTAKLARLAVDFLSTIQLLPIGAQSLLAQLILL